jgi:hypothetical protein
MSELLKLYDPLATESHLSDVGFSTDILAVLDTDDWDCKITAQPRSADAAAFRLATLEPTVAVFA